MNKHEFKLSEKEIRVLKWHSEKQKETYIMRKFVHEYSFKKACFHEEWTLADCLIELNAVLIAEGYKPKKATSTVSRLLSQPFVSFDIEQNYYGGI
ncbi:hypothetical protein [Metabacillus litoralis]|uniref:hypothetical protein n=1 Tax=Metabacillus litoralis TaxID=152268 RepID=UPI00203B29F2|nr:hypothetical protein [Metabacillus litoralis]MCM3411870.1 hypothetical protein [Metabacillus litoralis]